VEPRYKLIALDMDGTLLGTDKEISDENLLWIERARQAGIEVTLSTGRHRKGIVKDFAERLQLRVPMVTLNGGEVWTHDGQLLARHTLSSADIVYLYEIAKAHGVRCWGSTTEGPIGEEHFPNPITDAVWVKFGLHSDHKSVIDAVWSKLSEHGGFELTNSDPLNIEINPKGVSKATGLQVVCDYLKIDQSEVIAMGDSFNDIEMLKWAGLGIAMGNAQDEVKRVADRLTDSCDNHGVARAIETVLSSQGAFH
jgi:HAD superfamily hydrolase (TIGR01484 family)